MKKQELKANLIISGPIFPEPVQVMMTNDMGHLVKVIGKGLRTEKFYDPILDADQLDTLTASPEKEPFDGDPVRFRLGIEGMCLGLAREATHFHRAQGYVGLPRGGWPRRSAHGQAARVEIAPEGGVSEQKVEETRSALRELGLNDI